VKYIGVFNNVTSSLGTKIKPRPIFCDLWSWYWFLLHNDFK